MLWVFSIILESVCILPQLLLLRQTTVPTVIDSFYLLTLGSYRGFYILNWIWRDFDNSGFRRKPDPISVIFGVIQTALYVDFAWVYWTRQRVKLRGGGMVDGEDMRRGWLLSKIFGRPSLSVDEQDEDEESRPALNGHGDGDVRRPAAKRNGSGWGARGISVSADEGVLADERETENENDVFSEGDAQMKDPDELAKILDDDDESSDGILPAEEDDHAAAAGISGGAEWRDGGK